MIICHSCHKELPENAYYLSNLNRGYIYCKDCCKRWSKDSKKRYKNKRKRIKDYKESMNFDKIMGGYTISMLYSPKSEEFKYCLHCTKNNITFYMNDASVLEQYFHKALKDVAGESYAEKKD